MTACCFDCRFFVPEGKLDASQLTEEDWDGGCCEGECRCRPPVLGDWIEKGDDGFRAYGEFPRVLGADWCGEFRPRIRLQELPGKEEPDVVSP